MESVQNVRITRMSEGEYRRYVEERSRILRRQVRRRVLLLAFVGAFLIFGIASLFWSLHTSASARHTAQKRCTFHTVAAGETLESVAEQYRDPVYYDSAETYCREVRGMNRMQEGEELYGGQLLLVPYYEEGAE